MVIHQPVSGTFKRYGMVHYGACSGPKRYDYDTTTQQWVRSWRAVVFVLYCVRENTR